MADFQALLFQPHYCDCRAMRLMNAALSVPLIFIVSAAETDSAYIANQLLVDPAVSNAYKSKSLVSYSRRVTSWHRRTLEDSVHIPKAI